MTKKTVSPATLLTITAISMVMVGCSTYQSSVQGSYATPNKRTAGMATGATAMAALTGASAGFAVAAAQGAGMGLVVTHARSSLMEKLASQGVIVIAQGDTLRLVLHSDQFFYTGSPALRPKRYPILDNVAALLKEYGKVPVTIAGYTDSIGSAEAQYELSQQQAESMRAYLWTHGLEHQYLRVVGYGAQHPVAANRGKGYAANRRIEITLKASKF